MPLRLRGLRHVQLHIEGIFAGDELGYMLRTAKILDTSITS